MTSAAHRLLDKLHLLDLDDDEAALLTTVFRHAAEAGPEVEGFAMASVSGDPFGSGFEFPSRNATKPFKGTDEELQAIVDWLGSLEAQK